MEYNTHSMTLYKYKDIFHCSKIRVYAVYNYYVADKSGASSEYAFLILCTELDYHTCSEKWALKCHLKKTTTKYKNEINHKSR